MIESMVIRKSHTPYAGSIAMQFHIPKAMRIILILRFRRILPVIGGQQTGQSSPIPTIGLQLGFRVNGIKQINRRVEHLNVIRFSNHFTICGILARINGHRADTFPRSESVNPLNHRLTRGNTELLFQMDMRNVHGNGRQMIFGAQINRFECADFPGRACDLSRIRVQLKFFQHRWVPLLAGLHNLIVIKDRNHHPGSAQNVIQLVLPGISLISLRHQQMGLVDEHDVRQALRLVWNASTMLVA